jgi:hypothetical protein
MATYHTAILYGIAVFVSSLMALVLLGQDAPTIILIPVSLTVVTAILTSRQISMHTSHIGEALNSLFIEKKDGQESKHMAYLDGLRGYACVQVLALHLIDANLLGLAKLDKILLVSLFVNFLLVSYRRPVRCCAHFLCSLW